ncbi:MAG TPA: sensor domain-containing diguanylate cyclase [Burkholderiales bacterium]|nr:sensor domain-containing diguanylate cyclase [Burkholderiales bacterium]
MAAQQSGAAVPPRRQPSGAEESARLSALRGYCVLDTGREARFDDLTGLAANICDTPVSLVSLVDTNRLFFKSAHGLDAREVPHPDFFCGHAIRQRDVFVVPDAAADPRFAKHPLVVDPPRVRFYAGVPLVTPQDHALGTLCVVDFVPRQLGARQIETLRILGRQVMSQLELNLQAMRDPLTDLYNRRQLEESLHREILRARRLGATVGVMAIDVDHFKRVNDTLGHEIGDVALRGIAEELASCVREEDIACRAGGEEFVIILPGTGKTALRSRAEAVRRTVEQARIPAGEGTLKLTVSIGLASFPSYGDSGQAVLRAADVALYKAKAAGRNRVIMCAPSGARPTSSAKAA